MQQSNQTTKLIKVADDVLKCKLKLIYRAKTPFFLRYISYT